MYSAVCAGVASDGADGSKANAGSESTIIACRPYGGAKNRLHIKSTVMNRFFMVSSPFLPATIYL